MTIPMTSERVAPRDPQEKRPGFYVMLDKPVGGLPSNDGRGHHPIYINGDRLVTFAKMVGGIQDDSILELLRTAKGFRQLVHHIGVSATADSAMPVRMTLGFEGERGSAGSRHGVDLVANGQEAILDVAGLDWADTDANPGELLFDMPTPKDIVSATVKLYLNDGYTVPEVDPDPPVAFDSPAYAAMIARSALSTGNNARVKRVLADLRAGKPVTIAFIGGSITQGAGAVPTQEMCYARRTFEGICEKYAADPSKVRYIKAGVGGTPSQLGLVRYDRDITRDGAVHPDLVVVEFAVNDEGDETKGLLLRKPRQAHLGRTRQTGRAHAVLGLCRRLEPQGALGAHRFPPRDPDGGCARSGQPAVRSGRGGAPGHHPPPVFLRCVPPVQQRPPRHGGQPAVHDRTPRPPAADGGTQARARLLRFRLCGAALV